MLTFWCAHLIQIIYLIRFHCDVFKGIYFYNAHISLLFSSCCSETNAMTNINMKRMPKAKKKCQFQSHLNAKNMCVFFYIHVDWYHHAHRRLIHLMLVGLIELKTEFPLSLHTTMKMFQILSICIVVVVVVFRRTRIEENPIGSIFLTNCMF